MCTRSRMRRRSDVVGVAITASTIAVTEDGVHSWALVVPDTFLGRIGVRPCRGRRRVHERTLGACLRERDEWRAKMRDRMCHEVGVNLHIDDPLQTSRSQAFGMKAETEVPSTRRATMKGRSSLLQTMRRRAEQSEEVARTVTRPSCQRANPGADPVLALWTGLWLCEPPWNPTLPNPPITRADNRQCKQSTHVLDITPSSLLLASRKHRIRTGLIKASSVQ